MWFAHWVNLSNTKYKPLTVLTFQTICKSLQDLQITVEHLSIEFWDIIIILIKPLFIQDYIFSDNASFQYCPAYNIPTDKYHLKSADWKRVHVNLRHSECKKMKLKTMTVFSMIISLITHHTCWISYIFTQSNPHITVQNTERSSILFKLYLGNM